MKLKTLGSTGLIVSHLGLGMAALGRPGYINLGHEQDLEGEYDEAAMELRADRLLDSAWNAGIRYFDAARSYGLGEQFLGSWLTSASISPTSATVGSKWGYTYTARWKVHSESHEIKDHSLAVLQRQWKESNALLNGYLDLYQIHSATAESRVLDRQDVLKELARMKSTGVHIGLTLSGPDQVQTLRQAMGIEFDGVRLFETVQATWNLLEPSAGPALSEAHAAGMGIIIKEALANGRLTDRNRDPDFAPKLAILQEESARLNTSIDALLLAAVLARPFADVVLSGATTETQLASNLNALALHPDTNATARLAELAEPVEVYWATRKKLSWN